MRKYEDKLKSLSDKSVWKFPKQDTDFDNAFKAAKLFHEIPHREDTNIEKYFAEYYTKYDITTDRHRMLVIPQMYGLITKTPFYKRGYPYSRETVTPVFEVMNCYDIGSYQYNIYKTEQILKIKMKAIIDTTPECDGWHILPVVYSYCVLKNLKENHHIDSVSLSKFYTYVMTCSNFKDFLESIEFINSGAPASDFYDNYKDISRFINILSDNIGLFIIDNDDISINPMYDEYFQKQFIEKNDLRIWAGLLSNNAKYAEFLYNPQHFGLNIIDPIEITKGIKERMMEDIEYTDEVDKINEHFINEFIGVDAYKTEPGKSKLTSIKRNSKNPILGKKAIIQADYKCENYNAHSTFTSLRTGKPFMEAHHLIPMSYQEYIWNKFKVNVDCLENLVSLCPNCHRTIHYACNEEKKVIINNLYKIKEEDFKRIGLSIGVDELIKLYFV